MNGLKKVMATATGRLLQKIWFENKACGSIRDNAIERCATYKFSKSPWLVSSQALTPLPIPISVIVQKVKIIYALFIKPAG
jgi:hypothetical protein